MTASGYPQQRYDPNRLKPGPSSLGWGLVGASDIARRVMVEAIRRQPSAPDDPNTAGAWVVGVFSHQLTRGQSFANKLQLPLTFASLEALLRRAEIHCVYISNHPRRHSEMALAAIDAGKHILCEAPLALTVDEARQVQQAAQKKGVLLAMNYPLRAEAALGQMRALLQERAIGDLLGGRSSNAVLLEPALHTWRLQPEGGGVILDRTIREIDLLRWLFQDEINRVSAMGSQQVFGQGVEDNVVAGLHFAWHKLFFQLHDSYLVPHQPSSVEVYGTTGTLVAPNCFGLQPTGELFRVRNEEIRRIPVEANNPFWHSVRVFNDAVRGQSPLLASAHDGVVSLKVALALQESIRTGQAISVDYLDL